jgi:hypothetical protein
LFRLIKDFYKQIKKHKPRKPSEHGKHEQKQNLLQKLKLSKENPREKVGKNGSRDSGN